MKSRKFVVGIAVLFFATPVFSQSQPDSLARRQANGTCNPFDKFAKDRVIFDGFGASNRATDGEITLSCAGDFMTSHSVAKVGVFDGNSTREINCSFSFLDSQGNSLFSAARTTSGTSTAMAWLQYTPVAGLSGVPVVGCSLPRRSSAGVNSSLLQLAW
jgi:hypothetical protein